MTVDSYAIASGATRLHAPVSIQIVFIHISQHQFSTIFILSIQAAIIEPCDSLLRYFPDFSKIVIVKVLKKIRNYEIDYIRFIEYVFKIV